MKKYKSKSALKHFILTAIFATMCWHGTAQTNTAPTITGTPVSGIEGSDYTFAPIGADTDAGDTLTYSVSGQPDWLTITPATGVLTGKPSYTDAGTSSIVITVNDETTNATLSVDIVIADFTFPIHVSSIANGQNADGSTNTAVKLGNASGVAVLGDYAYVTSYHHDGIEILDISTGTPVHAGFIGDTAKLDGASNIVVVESGNKTYAYVASEVSDSVSIIDVTTPASSTIVGYITNGRNAHNGDTAGSANPAVKLNGAKYITVVGNFAYVATNGTDIEVLNISNPTTPLHVSSISNGQNADGTTNAAVKLNGIFDIEVVGDFAYVAANVSNAIEILNISTGTPVHAESISDTDTTALSYPRSIAVVGDYAYVGTFNDGVSILDISNPASISQVGSIAEDSTINLETADSITVVGNYAYVTSYESGGSVTILDISDKTAPIVVGSISDNGDATIKLNGPRGITVVGNYAYVAANLDAGLEILQIAGIVRSGNLILGDQVAIDGLSSSFVKIAGNLMVKETIAGTITSLTGLSNIISVGGNLEIVGNASLTSLEGLDDLEILEGKLYIGITAAGVSKGNTALVDFCAISNLVTGGASAQITNASATNEYFVGNNGYNPTYAGLGTRSPATTASETDGCTKFGTAVASTNTFSKEEDYRLFPNPVTDVLFVKGGGEITSISISNLSGQIVLKGNSASINVRYLSKGIYFAKIVSGEKVVVEKFIKL